MEEEFQETAQGSGNQRGAGGKKNTRKNKKGKNNNEPDVDNDKADDQQEAEANAAKRKEQQAKIIADMAAGGADSDSDDDPIFGKKGKKNQKKGNKKDDNKRQRQGGKRGKKGAANDDEEEKKGSDDDQAASTAAAAVSDDEERKELDNDDKATYPLKIIYCPKCTLPPEYCEFAGREGDLDECKAWLKENHEDMYDELYPALEDGEEAAAATGGKKKKKKVGISGDGDKKIRVIRQKRGGKKLLSSIVGLDKYGCDLVAVAKIISKKMGAGAAAMTIEYKELHEEGIQVQGDISKELENGQTMLESILTVDLKSYNIPIDKIVNEEGGNKKNRTMGGGR